MFLIQNFIEDCTCESKNPENLIRLIDQPTKDFIRYKCMRFGHDVDVEVSNPFNKIYDEYNLTRKCNHEDYKLLERIDDNYLSCRVCHEKIYTARECGCYFDPSCVEHSELQSLNNTDTFDCTKCGRNFSKCRNWDNVYISKFKSK